MNLNKMIIETDYQGNKAEYSSKKNNSSSNSTYSRLYKRFSKEILIENGLENCNDR